MPLQRSGILYRLLVWCLGCSIAVILLSGCNPFKAPMNDKQEIALFLDQLNEAIKHEKWATADKQYRALQDGWASMRWRIYLNANTDEISKMETGIAELEVYINEKEKTDGLATVQKLKQFWEDIAKF